jgi:hypothetical protein
VSRDKVGAVTLEVEALGAEEGRPATVRVTRGSGVEGEAPTVEEYVWDAGPCAFRRRAAR